MAKRERSYLVCNVTKNAKKPHTVVSLMIKETIILLTDTCHNFIVIQKQTFSPLAPVVPLGPLTPGSPLAPFLPIRPCGPVAPGIPGTPGMPLDPRIQENP